MHPFAQRTPRAFTRRCFCKKNAAGFTLIEILVVIGIIAMLAAVVIVAVNPARQFAQARDSQRIANVNALLSAIGQRIADNKGVFEGTFSIAGRTYSCGKLPTATTSITNAMAADEAAESGALGCLTPAYIPQIPRDPQQSSGAGTGTGYSVVQDEVGRVQVCAQLAAAETAVPNASAICVTR